MCDERSRRDVRGKREDVREEFYADSSIITKKSFFRFIKGLPREEYIPSWPKPLGCVYPKANAYYAYHEDANPFTRFPARCESRKYGNIEPHFGPPEEPYTIRDPYYEIEARKKYLASEPTCFVVLGKPDLSTAKLASMIANSWKCVLISPAALINEEIGSGSEKGKAMADILKAGERLGPDIVMDLIINRVNKRDVFHKGYVVEGLPLIPNGTLDYSSYPKSNEKSTAQKISDDLTKFFDSSVDRICGTANELEKRQNLALNKKKVCVRELEDTGCTKRPDYERVISGQIEEIFTTWPRKPTIIIYAMCPDEDDVKKREHFRIDPTTGRTVDTSLLGMSKDVETLFAHNKLGDGMNISFELYQELMNEERILDEDQRKYLLRRPADAKSNIEAQCALYRQHALPVIEKWITLHNPQNVIRVDARTPVSLMFQIVITRLRTLPVPRVILPRKFVDQVAFEFEGESPMATAPTDEFEEKPIEEAFQDLANRETIAPLFPWRLSAWNFLCPVELARGRSVEGAAKHAIKFINKIFFLSSSEAVDLFMENPRTFLFPFTPRPTCKLVVFGPKYSGKSDLCRKLARFLKGTVINVNEIGKSLDDADSDVSFYSPSSPKLDEKTNTIASAIQSIPNEELDIEVWRDGGYIVDGMYPDADCWKILVENSEIVFEDAILLFDEDPFDYLLSVWHKIHRVSDEDEGDYENRENEEEMYGLIEYLNQIRKFEVDWKTIEENVVNTCRNLIACNISKIDDVSSYVISLIQDRYTEKARVMTEEEKEKEKDLAEYMAMTEDTENIEDEEEEREGEKERTDVDIKEDNRRFGDTSHYCPVALMKHNVFWKGKEEFSAVFMDRIYYLSSESALEEFLRGPQKLGLPLKKPLPLIAPLRISVIGPTGSGKSTLSDSISREYGLAHVDYFQSCAMYLKSCGTPLITHIDVIVSPEKLSEEVELPADMNDEKYNSDSATVQTFVRSYWKKGGDLPARMYQECIVKHFKGLFGQSGVVLNQFPSCRQDVEIALKNYMVPEVIIELRCGKDTAYKRMTSLLLETWRHKLDEKKAEESVRYTTELEEYEIERNAWIENMLSKNRRKRGTEEESDMGEFEGEEYMAEYMEDQEEEAIVLTRFELEEIWYRDNPQPVLFTDWETEEMAKERMDKEFHERYDDETAKVNAVRESLEGESITYISIDGEGDPTDICLRVMRILDPYVRRNVSTLEKAYTVDVETAETLLNHGYYLLSSFARWCPVQLYQNKVPLHMFLPQEVRQEIHAVIHRQFIYFLSDKEAHSAFLRNPLKYFEVDSCVPVVPFRLAIVGPPKCGKSTLAERFARKYNMKVITRGAALRHVMKHFSWTEFVQSAESSLRLGKTVPMESVHRAVEMYSIDPSSVSQGFVLDGFPVNREEYEAVALLSLQPMVILDLKADLAFCLECLSQGADYTKKPPNFSNQFLTHRYSIWQENYGKYRSWLQKFTQNIIEVDATMCRWYVWTRADEEVCSRYMTIRSYFRESDYEKVHRLKYMSVSLYEFTRRQSQFEFYCPMCLYLDDILRFSGPPPDHEGMVQFREHFYWICPQHLEQFVRKPLNYLPPVNDKCLPKDRPRIITEKIDPEHPCWTRRLQIKGFCLVTYVERLPDRRLVPGKTSLAVIYKNKIYLFCTEECRDKFLARPETYTSVDIKFLRVLPPIDIHKLPNLGFLEQTVAQLIIRAVNQVSVVRPKLPGLSPSATAAIYIGVFLKAHNKSCALKEVDVYKAVIRRICDFEKILKVATRTIKRQLNPALHLPGYKYLPNRAYGLMGQLSTISRIFTRPSTSIAFRRTSPTQILVDPSSGETSDD